MARSFGQIKSAIWQDDDFKTGLGVDAQWLYFVLLSQPNLNTAGVLPLQDRRWRKLAKDLTAERVEAALAELRAHWYVVVDEDTEEVLVRTFIRNDDVWKQPNVLKGALEQARHIMSPTLRGVVRDELSRLPVEELPPERADKARALIERVRATLPGTLPEGFREPPRDPSGRPSDAEEDLTNGQVTAPFPAPDLNQQVTGVSQEPGQPALEGFPEGFENPSRTLPEGSGPGPGPGPGLGPGESSVEEEIPKTSSSGAPSDKPTNAGDLTAWWIDQCNQRPPKRTIGHMSKEIKNLLDEGIDPHHIRNGIAAWMAKECGPSALPSFVNQAMNVRRLPTAANRSSDIRGGSRDTPPDHTYWRNITDEDLRNVL